MKVKYIYLLTNKINNKRYVGQTTNLKMRLYNHFDRDIKRSNTIFQQDKKQYGKENFVMTVLEVTNDTQSNARERYWIEKLGTASEYNFMVSSGTTKEEDEEMIKEFLEGKTLVDIEKEKHVHRGRISNLLKEQNVDTYKNSSKRPLQEERYLIAKELYLQGNSIRDISARMNICRKTLSKRFKEDNLLVIKPNDNRHKHPYRIHIAT